MSYRTLASDSHMIVLCNGASRPHDAPAGVRELRLDYIQRGDTIPDISIGLPNFVGSVYHLPHRLLDLLEIAAYVYCADRRTHRGRTDSVEYHSWSRSLRFVIRVRDSEFWSRESVRGSLQRALQFMTGDSEYIFSFQPGQATPPTSLFDSREFCPKTSDDAAVVLFSGGLDSLCGTIQLLQDTSNHVCLVSHRSQHGTKKTQDRLADALKNHYPGRLSHYKFECHLRKTRAVEETQRTRAFLYSCIASAIAHAWGQTCFLVFENGVTSMNFPRREDLANARASRTTHPQTIYHLQQLFSVVMDQKFHIDTPLLWKTKADIMAYLSNSPHAKLIPSSVSCSKTFQNLGQYTHCGGCSQCIDRRFAAYAVEAQNWDHVGLYKDDIVSRRISEGSVRTTTVDYLRQAGKFASWNVDHFSHEMISELSELVGYMPGRPTDSEMVEHVWQLCRRHGQQVSAAMYRMRAAHDDLFKKCEHDSLLQLISDREYLKRPVIRLVRSIDTKLSVAIPKMFASTPPSDERDFNLKVSALLDSHNVELSREHPAIAFAAGHAVPDHGNKELSVIIESKYLRNSTTPSRASEGIAADLTKYPETAYILFLVYDPQHSIKDDRAFRRDFESFGRCTVSILR